MPNSLSFLSDTFFYGVYFSQRDSSLQIDKIPIPKYTKFNILKTFLRYKSEPFSIRELRSIGLNDIITDVEKRKCSIGDWNKWKILKDEDTITLIELQQRILDLQFNFFVTHSHLKYIYSTSIESLAISYVNEYKTLLKPYSQIRQIFITRTENNAYISIEDENSPYQLSCDIKFDNRIWVHLFANIKNSFTINTVKSQYQLPPYTIHIHLGEYPFSLSARYDNIPKSNMGLADIVNTLFEQPPKQHAHKITIQNRSEEHTSE